MSYCHPIQHVIDSYNVRVNVIEITSTIDAYNILSYYCIRTLSMAEQYMNLKGKKKRISMNKSIYRGLNIQLSNVQFGS